MKLRALAIAGFASASLFVRHAAHAGRPLVTDDAGVVSGGSVQLETWFRFDRDAREIWAVPGIGPIEALELSAGAAVGMEDQGGSDPELSGAVAQAKLLGREPDPAGAPGLASALGVFPPLGTGAFERKAWFSYAHLALTEVPLADERLSLHVNLGVASELAEDVNEHGVLWGAAADVRTIGELHAVAEIVSAAPATDGAATSAQIGAYLVIGDHVQLDATVGKGLSGDEQIPVFATFGLKLSSNPLW